MTREAMGAQVVLLLMTPSSLCTNHEYPSGQLQGTAGELRQLLSTVPEFQFADQLTDLHNTMCKYL